MATSRSRSSSFFGRGRGTTFFLVGFEAENRTAGHCWGTFVEDCGGAAFISGRQTSRDVGVGMFRVIRKLGFLGDDFTLMGNGGGSWLAYLKEAWYLVGG